MPDLNDRTLRQMIRISVGGDRLRLKLSNEESGVPVAIRTVRVALAGPDGTIVAGSGRTVTFDGRPSVTMAASAPMLSDPVAMPVTPGARIAIDLYFATDTRGATGHDYANGTAWLAPGDQTGAVRLRDAVPYKHRLIVSAVDVDRPSAARVVVALGDSITDGGLATEDADRRWPDLLAERLRRAGVADVGVANAGISGNQLLGEEGYGHSALARFDRDVIAVPGAHWVIVFEGINDIVRGAQHRPPLLPSAEAMIAGYRQLIARGHAAGLTVYLATVMPYRVDVIGADGEGVRQTINAWIRANREADGLIDFDKVMRDPANPARLAAAYDSGDTLHPNDTGFAAMVAAIDLASLIGPARSSRSSPIGGSPRRMRSR